MTPRPSQPVVPLPNRRRGFTLLEVMLAVALSVLVVGAVLALHSYARDVRQGVLADVETVSDIRLAMDRLSGELRSSLGYQFIATGLARESGRVEFVAAALPAPSAWGQTSLTDPRNNPPPQHDHEIVGYRLRVALDEQGEPMLDIDGNPIVEGLERTSQKVLVQVAEEGKQVETSLLSTRIRFFRVEYFDPQGTADSHWMDQWPEQNMPPAVRITLGAEPLPLGVEPAEYPYEKFQRVIDIPTCGRSLSIAPSGEDTSASSQSEEGTP